MTSILSLSPWSPGPGRLADEPVDFARDVLPILSTTAQCHGPDEKARKADLRLDLKDHALRQAGPVIVPGKSGGSEVVRRIESADSSEVMPPRKANKDLKPAQVAILKRWIDQGRWGKHWAFEPPTRPAVPVTRESAAFARNPIDHFVFARLAKAGLKPSPARPQRLLRASLST